MGSLEFLSEADKAIRESPSDETFWQIVPDLFNEVLGRGLYVSALNELLAGIRDENLPITAHHTAGQFIALHTSPYTSWAIIFHKTPPRFLYLSPVDALQSRIGGSQLSVTRYACEEPRSFAVLQRDIDLAEVSCDVAAPGEVFRRCGRREILDWSVASGELGPGVTLRVNSGLLAEFEWAFDRVTMNPTGLSGIDPIKSNLTTIFTLLASIGEASSVDYLLPFLGCDQHFIRWGAARAIAAIDSQQGLVAVEALAGDPHEEVRAAARAALAAPAAA